MSRHWIRKLECINISELLRGVGVRLEAMRRGEEGPSVPGSSLVGMQVHLDKVSNADASSTSSVFVSLWITLGGALGASKDGQGLKRNGASISTASNWSPRVSLFET